MEFKVIILAAGRGTRMGSSLPKVLHPVAGQPMLGRLLKSLSEIYSKETRVVIGDNDHLITPLAGKFKALCFKQDPNYWGTAGAVLAARPEEIKEDILIINSDHALISGQNIKDFVQSFHQSKADVAVASFKNPHPNEYGRLLLDGDQLLEIVEVYDLEKRKIKSDYVNAGMYIFKKDILSSYLKKVSKNHKDEYNLTDVIKYLNKDNLKVRAIEVPWNAAFGINNQQELSVASNILFQNKCYELMTKGVIIVDSKNTYIESDVVVGQGSMIYPGVYLKGQTTIGTFCAIESNSFIFNSVISNYVNVKMGSYIEESKIGERSIIGPYAHLRPESVIGKECRIGNFVETKKMNMGDNSKAAHFSYLGDAEIGTGVNIGCGTVTCNYTVKHTKEKTKIGDNTFVGSGSQLVAPITIGEQAIIGAGSVITKDVPSNHLAIERSEQKNIKKVKKQKATPDVATAADTTDVADASGTSKKK